MATKKGAKTAKKRVKGSATGRTTYKRPNPMFRCWLCGHQNPKDHPWKCEKCGGYYGI